jgi:hypothetical protein
MKSRNDAMVLKKRSCGATKFEFALAVVLIGIFATFLLNRLSYYEAQAEKTNMESTVRAIKSGLRIQMATMMIHGRVQEYAQLAQQNPLDWLELNAAKDNDPGGKTKSDWGLLAGWSYDKSTQTLVYSVKHGDDFQSDTSGNKRIRWKVKLIRDEADPAKPVVSVALELMELYRW